MFFRCLGILFALLIVSGCATSRISVERLPKGLKINKSVVIPTGVDVAVYVPNSFTKERFLMKYTHSLAEPGKAVNQALKDVGLQYFNTVELVNIKSDKKFGLLIDLNPKFENVSYQNVGLEFEYKLYDSKFNLLSEGSVKGQSQINYNVPDVGVYNASVKASQTLFVKILNKFKPSIKKYATLAKMSEIQPELIANLEEPVSSGTGFFVNKEGQVVTAAHVLKSCLITKVVIDEQPIKATLHSKSNLLDVAVLSTNTKVKDYLTFRKKNNINLGEDVVVVGYPLKGLLEASANMTKGNVTSLKGMQGDLGSFQFSAAIASGSSGGPVVSANGELLGMVTSGISSEKLQKIGALSENIYFGLQNRFIHKYFEKHGLTLNYSPKNLGNVSGAEKALKSTVQIACYE